MSVFLLGWVVVVVVVALRSIGCGENRDAEKVRNRRCGKERSVTRYGVFVETSSAVWEMEADEYLLQGSLSARVYTARVRTAMEGYPNVP